ncbi:MAG: hypothetical protein JST30_01950 [Armatimonadetes bacterium]|nr:hypothetical protein [Armatimonadota bacterium]
MKGWNLIFVIAMLALSGCGAGAGDNVTVQDAQGNKVTTDRDGGKVTVEGAKGEKATFESDGKGGGTVTSTTPEGRQSMTSGTSFPESELGLPFYPGSTEKPEGSFKSESPTGSSHMSVRSTKDEQAKVAAFYKSKLKDPTSVSTNGNEMLTGKLPDGSNVQNTATREEGQSETTIGVLVVREKH